MSLRRMVHETTAVFLHPAVRNTLLSYIRLLSAVQNTSLKKKTITRSNRKIEGKQQEKIQRKIQEIKGILSYGDAVDIRKGK
jgi:hypothetical protein